MFKRIILLFAILQFAIQLKGQLNLSPIWCFGKNAGLDFSSNPPGTFTTPMITSEGSGGVTNGKGELMFYSDGQYVYNKNHKLMPNGQGLTGSSSSSQSAIVLQHPSQKSKNQFYIFTVPEYAGSAGFCYSIVDMDDDNGLGDVVVKNVRLYNGVLSEQMQPAMHSNGKDYWIVIKGFSNTEIHSFLIDQSGVTLKQTANLGNTIYNTIGCMRFNKQYSKFAFTCYDNSGYFEICDFNNTTGVISNALVVDNLYDPYGIAFSPNGKYLYVSHLLTRKVNQYDLSNYNPTAILNSAYPLTSASYAFGNIDVAIDGKLYMAITSQQFIACISNPDNKGAACNFNLNAVSLGANTCLYGLPLFYDYPKNNTLNIQQAGDCAGDSVLFSASPVSDTMQWYLDTGNGYLYVTNTSSFKYLFKKEGTYKVKVVTNPEVAEMTFQIITCEPCDIVIPNVFTPDKDLINDRFDLKFECAVKDFKITIYNRWGIELFESNNPYDTWDGSHKSVLCPSGVYYYIIEYTDKDSKSQIINGVIQLIR